MANEVAKSVFGGKIAVADVKSLAQKAAAAAQNNPRGGAPDGSEYLNFSGKRGKYQFGQEKTDVSPDELWVVDVGSFEEGWVCWKGGQPAASRMANIYSGVPIAQPNMDELGPFNSDKGEGWFQAKGLVLKSTDTGRQGYFRLNSVSGVSEMAKLMGEFAERAEAGEPCWPVVALTCEEFEAQGFKNFKPIFDVQGWLTTEQLQALANEETTIDELLDIEQEEVAPPPPPVTGRRRRAV